MATFLSDHFGVGKEVFDEYGAFNVSIINDLPLFIDPFLLFHSEKEDYVKLHDQIIKYLVFLRDRAAEGQVDEGLLRGWYCFPEVKQNWLGFSVSGNGGTGLGIDFGRALHANLHVIFSDFGREKITEGSHLEKVCLVADGVGRDNISDFTTNLIQDYLCRYTEAFAISHLSPDDVSILTINRAKFNFATQTWERGQYKLPWVSGDYIILTPKDMLTRDENWINRGDLISNFEQIPTAIPDAQLRASVFNYFNTILAARPRNKGKDKEPTQKQRGEAAVATMRKFPEIIDYYIKRKEETGEEAADLSSQKVIATEFFYIHQLQKLQRALLAETEFYQIGKTTYEEAHARLAFLKDVIENKGGWRIFYNDDGKAVEREKDVQILYRLVWFGSPSDPGTEVNDGRGPVDFKISRGAKDKTLVEMKLAKNTKLERNLEKQVEIYQAASDAENAIKAIMFFTVDEKDRVTRILKKLNLSGHKDVVLIDARDDNKPSASVA
jgi:hypothetical protein